MKNDGRSIYTQAHPGEEPNPEGGAERRTVLEKVIWKEGVSPVLNPQEQGRFRRKKRVLVLLDRTVCKDQ